MDVIFSIITKNYYGLAQVLAESIKKYSDIPFYIFVTDEFEDTCIELSDNCYQAKTVLGIEACNWDQMSFKYNLIEFCTSIKAAAFKYFFNKGYSKVIYFDPDIYLFSSPDTIFNDLEGVDMILTPHIIDHTASFNAAYPDYLFLLNGTYNLGFLALKKSNFTHCFLDWWHEHLVSDTFFDNEKGTATDQKWINLVPALFPEGSYRISRNIGLNMAPWNFHERSVQKKNDGYYLRLRYTESSKLEPLVFVHFSGFNYLSFLQGDYFHKSEELSLFSDILPLYQEYADALRNSKFQEYVNLPYTYSTFENGTVILHLHRRLYRRLLDTGSNFRNPFSIGENSFYSLLQSKGLIDNQVILADKVTNKTIKGFDTKIRYVHYFFIIIKAVIGIRYYTILIRFLKRFSAEENQVFLLGKKYTKRPY